MGERGTPKSGRTRSVPMVPEAAQALARLLRRDDSTDDDDPVFVGEAGGYLDGSALRRRFRPRRSEPSSGRSASTISGTRSAASPRGKAESGRELQEWMGHADLKTTARYTHYRARGERFVGLRRRSRSASPVEAEEAVDAVVPR